MGMGVEFFALERRSDLILGSPCVKVKSHEYIKGVRMLTDGDVVKITSKSNYEGEELVNVFFYLVDALVAGVALIDIVTQFVDDVIDALRPLQVGSLTHTVATIENVTNGIDVDTLIINGGGQDTGGGAQTPSYVAAGYRLNVGDRTTRDGSKRFGGIGENRVAGNDYEPDAIPAATFLTRLPLTLDVVGTPTGTADLIPIIVGRDILGALDLGRLSPIVSATQLGDIRSQVSRRSPPA